MKVKEGVVGFEFLLSLLLWRLRQEEWGGWLP